MLGCTHFPFLYKVVKSVVGENVKVIDPADYVVFETKHFLEEVGFNKDGNSKTIFYTTDDKEFFKDKLSIFLNEKDEVIQIDI